MRVLLRNGVPYGAFAEIARRVYVEVAEKDFALPSKKQTGSRISTITGLTRKEVARIQTGLTTDARAQSRARAIAGVLSAMRTELEEVLTPGLRGYGALEPETEAALDAKFARLLTSLESMNSVISGGRLRGAR